MSQKELIFLIFSIAFSFKNVAFHFFSFLILGCVLKYIKVHIQTLIQFQYACKVFYTHYYYLNWLTEPVAVVGCGPDSAELVVKENLISFHAKLVRSKYLFHRVFMKEPVDDVYPEHVPGAPRGQSEACVAWVWVGIGPHEVSEGSLVRDFLHSLNLFDIRYMLYGRRKACMHAKDWVVYDCGDWQVVEEVGEKLPDCRVAIFPLTFSVETVHLSDLSSFMIPSQ